VVGHDAEVRGYFASAACPIVESRPCECSVGEHLASRQQSPETAS
jgi:hypothetical protein